MATAERETISVGSCPTCGGPAQFIDEATAAAEGHTPVGSIGVREVRLPNVDEDLGGKAPRRWHLTELTRPISRAPGRPPWRATAMDRDRRGDNEYGWGDTPSAAYLALRTAIEARS